MEKLVYIVYPVLIVLLSVGMKISKRGEWNEEFMSLSQTKYLQGYMAILVLLHHMGQKTCAPWHEARYIVHGLDLFVNYGFYFVSVFMFCTGYGLYKSVTTKDNYLKGFFRKRILPLIITFYSAGYIFLIVRILLKQKIRRPQMIRYITGFEFPNPNSWYLIAMPIFYLVFYLCFRFIKNEKTATTVTCLGVVAYIILGTYFRHNPYWFCGEWWYQSSPFFIFGLLFGRNEKPVIEHIKKHFAAYLITCFVLIFVLNFTAMIANNVFSYYYGEYSKTPVPRFSMMWRKWVTLLFHVLAAAAFVFFIFIGMMKVKIGNAVLKFMGTITLEFYIIHGLFVELFGYNFADSVKSLKYIRNPGLHLLITVICSVPAAFLLKKWVDLFRKKG